MIKLPEWLNDFFNSFSCPHCKAKLIKKGVFGIGIKEDKNQLFMCFDYLCKSCKGKTNFVGFPIELGQFAEYINNLVSNNTNEEETDINTEESSNLIDQEPDFQKPIKNKKKKSNISQKDIESFKEILNQIKTHDEFLQHLGINSNKYKE